MVEVALYKKKILTFDVHGISHGLAMIFLEKLLKDNEKMDSFAIINGKGLHNKSQQAFLMQEAIQKHFMDIII